MQPPRGGHDETVGQAVHVEVDPDQAHRQPGEEQVGRQRRPPAQVADRPRRQRREGSGGEARPPVAARRVAGLVLDDAVAAGRERPSGHVPHQPHGEGRGEHDPGRGHASPQRPAAPGGGHRLDRGRDPGEQPELLGGLVHEHVESRDHGHAGSGTRRGRAASATRRRRRPAGSRPRCVGPARWRPRPPPPTAGRVDDDHVVAGGEPRTQCRDRAVADADTQVERPGQEVGGAARVAGPRTVSVVTPSSARASTAERAVAPAPSTRARSVPSARSW